MGATVFYESASELATLGNTFAVSGTPTDPDTVALTVTSPSGTNTTYTYAGGQVTRTGAGVYTRDIACSEDGTWSYVWAGTGAASDVTAGTWTVFTTDLSKRYASVEELKSRLGITDTVDDFELALVVDTVSRAIDETCSRQFWRGTATRLYQATDPYWVTIDDLVSLTALSTDDAGDGTFETTWTAADYQLRPVNAATWAEARPYTEIRAVGTLTFPTGTSALTRAERVQVVGVFGWPAVPTAVKQAALILAADLFRLKDAPFGVAAVGDFAMRVRDNSRASALLSPYIAGPGPVLVG